MGADEERQANAKQWAHRIRRLEPLAMSWVYGDGDEESAHADLARRTLAQATGLRRLLEQMAGRGSAHGEEQGR